MRADAVLAVKRATTIVSPTAAGSVAGPGDRAIAASGSTAARKLSSSRMTSAARDRIGRTALGSGAAKNVAQRSVGAHRRPLNSMGDGRAKDDSLAQRVACKAICAMQSSTSGLAARPEASYRTATLSIHRNATHVIVLRWTHRDRLARWIDAGPKARRGDSRKARLETRADCRARVEKHTPAVGVLAQIARGRHRAAQVRLQAFLP